MSTRFISMLEKHVPAAAVAYCNDLWIKHAFTFKLKRSRASKLGDYRYDPAKKKHIISVNNDLNPYAFLITYLHEVAHQLTFENYKNKVAPHGVEWKSSFKTLMRPVMHPEVFPDTILRPLARYLKNPKASSCNDHSLMKALHLFDVGEAVLTLEDIAPDALFRFRKRTFKKEKLRRTRYVCEEVTSGRRYLISKVATVEGVDAAALK